MKAPAFIERVQPHEEYTHLDWVAGVKAPAFIERRLPGPMLRTGRAWVAGVKAPAFIVTAITEIPQF